MELKHNQAQKGGIVSDGRWVSAKRAKFRQIRGAGVMTVRCERCRHEYSLPIPLVEQFRASISPAGRMQRTGQSMATLGFAHGAKIEFAQSAAAVACSQCGSSSIELYVAPKSRAFLIFKWFVIGSLSLNLLGELLSGEIGVGAAFLIVSWIVAISFLAYRRKNRK
jgi:ribosomal protein S27E